MVNVENFAQEEILALEGLGTSHEFPIELLSLSDENGVRLRATVSEFGPVLFSKVLELNDTQSSYVSMIFKYCDYIQNPERDRLCLLFYTDYIILVS